MLEAFKLLKKDHAKFKEILEEMVQTTTNATAKRTKLLAEFKEALQLHEKIEETLLYPLLKVKAETKDLTLEAYEEHRLTDDLLAKIEKTETKDETWKAKITVLQECLEHHIEEEEKEFFSEAEKHLSHSQLEEIAENIKAMQQDNI